MGIRLYGLAAYAVFITETHALRISDIPLRVYTYNGIPMDLTKCECVVLITITTIPVVFK